jgi:UDPglucose 6-dehydrogenase
VKFWQKLNVSGESFMRVGIIGCGVIGGALRKACIAKDIDVVAYDPNKLGMQDRSLIGSTDLVFLCLPTPTVNGTQLLVALDSTLKWLQEEKYQGPVVIRSTVLPGTTKSLQGEYPELKLAHCPEFLTAATPFEDLIKQPVVLVGACKPDVARDVMAFWQLFDKKIPVQVGLTNETEMAKYIHNCFLATKVSFFNDIYELCQSLGIKYKNAVGGAIAVGQIGKGHTNVPGPDGEGGYGGMCFPKDMNALAELCEQSEIHAETIRGAIEGNKRRRSKPEDR